jgi:predicted nucleotidyltransferase
MLEEKLGVPVDLTTRKGLHPLLRKQIEAEATRVF